MSTLIYTVNENIQCTNEGWTYWVESKILSYHSTKEKAETTMATILESRVATTLADLAPSFSAKYGSSPQRIADLKKNLTSFGVGAGTDGEDASGLHDIAFEGEVEKPILFIGTVEADV